MKPEYLTTIFTPELERAVALLKETDPRSEDYGRLLFAIGELDYQLKAPAYSDFAANAPEVQPTATETSPAPDPIATPVTEESAPESATEPESASEPTAEYINPEDLRAALADAKKKGVNISELINSLGAPNFSGLRDDQNKLRQLKTLMENALKEIA